MYPCEYHPNITREEFVQVQGRVKGTLTCPVCREIRKELNRKKKIALEVEKELLTDNYCVSKIVRGTKLKKEIIPKELIDLKRAELKLYREIAFQNRPIPDCVKHGKLTLNDVVKSGKGRWRGEQRYKCKACQKELQRKHYQRNKENISAKQKAYRLANPEQRAETKKRYELKLLQRKLSRFNLLKAKFEVNKT